MSTARSSSRSGAAWALVLLAASLSGVAWSRAQLVPRFAKARVETDVFALPAPEQALVLSLGYRSAMADWLYSNVLVQSGIHVQERRRYEFVGEYLDVINALDPTFRSPYHFADTLLVLQAAPAREREYRKAREILLRGLKAFPHDGELWTNTGQYLTYLAAPHLKDTQEQQAWRLEGARIMARACELLGPSGGSLQSCFSAAGVLRKAGEREATIRFLQRFLSVSDDPELRAAAGRHLDHLNAEEQREQAEEHSKQLHEVWGRTLPFVSREALLLLGPPSDAARCAGSIAELPDCATSWRDHAERAGNAHKF